MPKLVRFTALSGWAVFWILCAWAGSVSAVDMDWLTVGAPGNPCDVQPQGCFGAVSYEYRIAKTEVTNAQYAEFLNAVAATDPNALYSTDMAGIYGGITRTGVSGGYTYTVLPDRGSKPVNYVSFFDSLRFANWLHNGQPIGLPGNATTEDGAYTIPPVGAPTSSIVRNAGATIVLTSEDEWYKAAYYRAVSASYFDYPAGANVMICLAPGTTANSANCNGSVGNLTDVGSYINAASPSGTFDQGGNVWEWNEAVPKSYTRGLRGGSFNGPLIGLLASFRGTDNAPSSEFNYIGFRVASVPEPATGVLVMTGLLGLAASRRRDGSS